MGTYEQLKAAVAAVIHDNGAEEITGDVMQQVLITLINSLGAGATFAGVAVPTTNPSSPDAKMFYLAGKAGTYTNFNLTITKGLWVFENTTGSWVGHDLEVSMLFASGQDVTSTNIAATYAGAGNSDLVTVGAMDEALAGIVGEVALSALDSTRTAGLYRVLGVQSRVVGYLQVNMSLSGTYVIQFLASDISDFDDGYTADYKGHILTRSYNVSAGTWSAWDEYGGGKFASGEKVADVSIAQTLGNSQTSVASQKAVTDAIYNLIDIANIDAMKNDATLRTGGTLARYTATTTLQGVTYKVGMLDVMSDSAGHVLTQILTTHYTITSGVLDTSSHSDGAVRQYYRSVKINGGTLPTTDWTLWKPINDEQLDVLSAAVDAVKASVGYYVCDTAAGTAAKVVSAAGYELATGGCIRIKMTNANTADSVTLNINSTGAKALYYGGVQASSTNSWEAGEVLEVYYDGTQYQSVSGGGGKDLEDDEYVIVKAFLRVMDKAERQDLEDDEEVIARAVGNHESRLRDLEEGGSGSGGGSSLSGTLSAAVSDTIVVLGSSFGIGYTTAGKHWVDIMNMFSDYSYQNLSGDGQSNLTRLIALRNGSIVPAKNAKYALVVNSENLTTSTDVNTTLQSFINLSKVLMSYGITPICGTSYRNISGFRQYNEYFSALLRKWCKDNNTLFMDAGEYTTVVGTGYNFERPGNTHLGTRQIPLVAYAYMDALHGLERPYQSMKTFAKRDEVTVTTLDDLMFSDNYGRAKVFKPTSSTTFNGYALISAVLPATARNIKKLSLSFAASASVSVYAINTNAQPFPTVSNYTRFHVDTAITVPAAGDTYSYNGTTFTVVYVETAEPYGAYCDIYCSPALQSAAEVSGTLTRVSGSGSASIAFTSYGIASLSVATAIMSDTIGHWEEIEADEFGMYTLESAIATMFIDKIHFLIVGTGSFTLSSPSIQWEAAQMKTNYQRTPVPDFFANSWNPNNELLTEPTFGNIGTTQSSWTDGNGNNVVSAADYEYTLTGSSYLPPTCTSILNIGATSVVQTTVDKNSFPTNCKMMVEVIARCFGNGFVNGTDTVTSDSWDWGNLIVSIGTETYTTSYKNPVGLMWRLVRVPIDIDAQMGGKEDLTLTIGADRNGFEIAKVSLKLI